MRHIFIFRSGRESRFLRQLPQMLAAYFEERGGQYQTLWVSTPEEAVQTARESCLAARDVRLYACGDDGLLHDIVNGAAAYPHAAVGIFPDGKKKDLAGSLGEAADFRNIQAQVEGCAIPMDLLSLELPGIDGPLYAVGHVALGPVGMSRLRRAGDPELPDITVEVDAKGAWRFPCFFALCANIPCWNGRRCVGWAAPDDGNAAYVLLPAGSRLYQLTAWEKFLSGRAKEMETARCGLCQQVTWQFESPVSIQVDGRDYAADRLRIQIVPRKIQFIRPGLAGGRLEEGKTEGRAAFSALSRRRQPTAVRAAWKKAAGER